MNQEQIKKVTDILININEEPLTDYITLYYIDGFVVKEIMCIRSKCVLNYYTIKYIDFIERSIVFLSLYNKSTIQVNICDLFLDVNEAIKVTEQRIADWNTKTLAEVRSNLRLK